MDDATLRGRSESPLRRSEAGIRRPLSAPARNLREGTRGAVPSRSVQSVPLEFVLMASAGRPPDALCPLGRYRPACPRQNRFKISRNLGRTHGAMHVFAVFWQRNVIKIDG